MSGLTTRVGDAEGDIDDLETDMSSAQGDITSLDTRVTALEQGGGGGGWEPEVVELTIQQIWDIVDFDPTYFTLTHTGSSNRWAAAVTNNWSGNIVDLPGGHWHHFEAWTQFEWWGSKTFTAGSDICYIRANPYDNPISFKALCPEMMLYAKNNTDLSPIHLQKWMDSVWPLDGVTLTTRARITLDSYARLGLHFCGLIYTASETYWSS